MKKLQTGAMKFWLALSGTVAVALSMLLPWAEIDVMSKFADKAVTANIFDLWQQVQRVNSLAASLNIKSPVLNTAQTIAFLVFLVAVFSIVLLVVSLALYKSTLHVKLARWGFGIAAAVSVVFIELVLVLNAEIAKDTDGILPGVATLSIFPYIAIAAALASLFFVCRRPAASPRAFQGGDIRRVALGGALAALVLLATYIIKLPVPATGGYVHPGDGVVLLAGVLLGPQAWLVAGIGSMLSDLLGGYMIYCAPTFAIKGLMAAFAGKFARDGKHGMNVLVFALAEAGMVAGYFVFESLVYGWAAAAGAVLPNVTQGVAGVVIGMILCAVAGSVKRVR